jgi:hypothetical protein
MVGNANDVYDDLDSGVGPQATVVVPASGKVLVIIANISSGTNCRMSFAATGVTAIDGTAITANGAYQSVAYLITGVTTGSNTFTVKYKRPTATTCTWSSRQITVIPLP